MGIPRSWFAFAILLSAASPAAAADNVAVERLATCHDSWLEWRTGDPARFKRFVDDFRTAFVRRGNDAFFVPRESQSVAGLPIAQAYPESVGMGVGFSVVVNAKFDATKAALERTTGKAFAKCEPPSDNMRTCERQIAEKKTLVLMAEDNPQSTTTLFGCFYLYEK